MSALLQDGCDDDGGDGNDECHRCHECRAAPAPAGVTLVLPSRPSPLDVRMFGRAHRRASP